MGFSHILPLSLANISSVFHGCYSLQQKESNFSKSFVKIFYFNTLVPFSAIFEYKMKNIFHFFFVCQPFWKRLYVCIIIVVVIFFSLLIFFYFFLSFLSFSASTSFHLFVKSYMKKYTFCIFVPYFTSWRDMSLKYFVKKLLFKN